MFFFYILQFCILFSKRGTWYHEKVAFVWDSAHILHKLSASNLSGLWFYTATTNPHIAAFFYTVYVIKPAWNHLVVRIQSQHFANSDPDPPYSKH